MLDSLPKPAIFAHRGASKHAPENTLTSFKLAIDQGADAIELDVQLSADKFVVVFHDNNLNRTTNGEGLLRDHKLESLVKLNAGRLFGPTYQDEKIPTLSEVFKTIGPSIYYNIELKNLLTPFDDLPARVVELIHNYQLDNYVLISSFNPIALYKVGKINPRIPKGILIRGRSIINITRILTSPFFDYASIHFPYNTISRKQLLSIQSSGKLAFTYTVNDPDDIRATLQARVDGLFTDDPALAREILIMENNH